MSGYFEVSGEKLERKFKECPEQGSGYWMAEHSDRFVCGSCSYTLWKDKKKRKK